MGNDKSDQAFAADAKKKDKKRNVVCFNCGNKGHIKAKCWSKGGGKEGQGPRRKRGGSKEGGKADTAATAESSKGKKEKDKGKDSDEDIEAWAVVEEEEEESPQIPVVTSGRLV